jgi:pimeloyl-[acyl-carrier protein] methyl ester esterase
MQAAPMTLVLMPGLDGTGKLFDPLIALLPEHLNVQIVRYTPREFFKPETLFHLISEDLPNEPFVLVAESFSSLLAIKIAATHPENLRGLVLCAGFASSPLDGWRRILAKFFAPILFHLPLPTFVIKHWLAGKDASDALIVPLRAALSSVAPAALTSRLRYVLSSDMRSELQKVGVPMLYLQATEDRLISTSCANEISRIQPKISIGTVNAPHLFLQTSPVEATKLLMDFLNRL